MTVATEEKDKLPLPGWSEKMAHGILSGMFMSMTSYCTQTVMYIVCSLQKKDH